MGKNTRNGWVADIKIRTNSKDFNYQKPDVVPLFCSSVIIDPLINNMPSLAGLVINLVILGNLRKSQSSLTHYHLTC